jgi:UDP-GlcNAc:undecaprenyl-phosphate GlcNAc-1-phosphate transferase
MLKLVLPTAVAAMVALALTPLVRRWALARGFVDRPDGGRKVQAASVALGGGAVVLLAFIAGAAAALWLLSAEPERLSQLWPLVGLLAAALLLCAVGLVDDRYGIRGGYKLLWQVAAASLIIGSGPAIDRVALFGVTVPLGALGYLLTMLWLLAAINSVNLIDGVDGLAVSVGLIFSLAVGGMALLTGHLADACIALAMAGALAGVLPYNVPPAKIYLGDAGSMIIGLVLGTLALKSSTKEAATLAFAAPLALWAIPMFDSGVAIARRWLTGRSIYASDRGHIHHRLLTRGLSAWQAVLIVSGLCAITSAAALASIYFRSELLGLAVVGIVVVALVATRVFGHVEFLLLNNRLLGIGRSLIPFSKPGRGQHTRVRLQGSLHWERLWESLIESAERFGLREIRLHVSLPQRHEDFYAEWRHARSPAADAAWSISVPVRLEESHAGQLRVSGEQTWESVSDQIREFLDFVEALHEQLTSIVHGQPHAAQNGRPAPTSELARAD